MKSDEKSCTRDQWPKALRNNQIKTNLNSKNPRTLVTWLMLLVRNENHNNQIKKYNNSTNLIKSSIKSKRLIPTININSFIFSKMWVKN